MNLHEFLEEFVFNKLSERQKVIAYTRQLNVFGFGKNLSKLAEIAKEYNVTTAWIREIEQKTKRIISHKLDIIASGIKDPHVIVKYIDIKEKQENQLMTQKYVWQLGELSVRTINCLASDNLECIDDLLTKTKKYLLKIPNFGHKSLKELEDLLAEHDLKLNE